MTKQKSTLMTASFYHKEFELPIDCVMDCSHSGQCFDDVQQWERKIALNYWTDQEKRDGLSEVGAWSREELSAMDETELNQKILWIACCDLREELNENS